MDLVRIFVDSLSPETVVVSGTEPVPEKEPTWGVDEVAIDHARKRGLETKVWPANWTKYGKPAGFIRNKDIVADSESVAAFWDGKSNGTKNSIDLTRTARKPLLIVHGIEPDVWGKWEVPGALRVGCCAPQCAGFYHSPYCSNPDRARYVP